MHNSSAAFVYWRILASVTKYLRLYIFIDSLLSTFIILIINSSIDKIYNFIKIIHLLLINNETTLRGELVLAFAVIINSLGVVLMLYSGTGISAISSVPYAFSEVFPKITLGTFTYMFQGLLVLSLMILRKKFVPSYLFSFVVGFIFGECIDMHNMWVPMLPTAIGFRIMYFIISYCLISLGIALSNRCKLPIIPTDLFPRELADITGVAYSRIKISFDVICLAVTACLTGLILGHVKGLGIGTVVAAFTMGKAIGLVGRWLDKKFDFVSFMKK